MYFYVQCTKCTVCVPEHGFVFDPPVEDSLLPLVWCQLVLIQHSVGEGRGGERGEERGGGERDE